MVCLAPEKMRSGLDNLDDIGGHQLLSWTEKVIVSVVLALFTT